MGTARVESPRERPEWRVRGNGPSGESAGTGRADGPVGTGRVQSPRERRGRTGPRERAGRTGSVGTGRGQPATGGPGRPPGVRGVLRSPPGLIPGPQLAGKVADGHASPLRVGFAQSLRLVLDVDGDLRQRGGMFPAVMRTEEQLSRVREQNADVRLGAAAITQIEGGQRLCGGYSSGQRRLPLLSASGSDQRRRLAVCFLQHSTTLVPASGFPGPRCVRHKRKPHSITLTSAAGVPGKGSGGCPG